MHVRGAVQLYKWQFATLNGHLFFVFAPRLRVTSRRTSVALCTLCLRWCHEWLASHSLPLGDATKISTLYACIHLEISYFIVLESSEGLAVGGGSQ